MDPHSEVLLHQRHLFTTPLLLAGLPADDLPTGLPQAQGWNWHAGEQAQLDARFPGRNRFDTRVPTGVWTSATLFLSKSYELTDYLLASLAARLSGGKLLLVGEKRGGIECVSEQLAAYSRPRKPDNARRCQFWQVRIEQTPAEPDPHVLTQHYSLSLAGGELQAMSLSGAFSHGRLDRGNALLLGQLQALPGGHLLDFGCNTGISGAVFRRRYPASRLILLDADAFTVKSSQLTLTANGLDGGMIAADGIDDALHELVAAVNNPPFHRGVYTGYQVSERLPQYAAEHLTSGGELCLIVNSFLKYPPLIERHLSPCRTLTEGDGFRTYSTRRS